MAARDGCTDKHCLLSLDQLGYHLSAVEHLAADLEANGDEIDLASKNASNLRKALKPYLDAGRKTGAGNARRIRTTRIGPDPKTVNEWARVNGYNVKDRGRFPNGVLEAFNAAN